LCLGISAVKLDSKVASVHCPDWIVVWTHIDCLPHELNSFFKVSHCSCPFISVGEWDSKII
jgi:hypothetical protein